MFLKYWTCWIILLHPILKNELNNVTEYFLCGKWHAEVCNHLVLCPHSVDHPHSLHWCPVFPRNYHHVRMLGESPPLPGAACFSVSCLALHWKAYQAAGEPAWAAKHQCGWKPRPTPGWKVFIYFCVYSFVCFLVQVIKPYNNVLLGY